MKLRDVIWFELRWYELVWYDMNWYGMKWYDVIWYGMVWYSMVRHVMWHDETLYDVISRDVSWYDMVWRRMNWCVLTWYRMAWYDLIWYMTCDMWYMIHVLRCMICDMWYMICTCPGARGRCINSSNAVKAHRAEHLQSVVTCGNDTQTKRCKTHPKTVLVPCFQKTSRSMHPWAMALTSSKALKLLNNTSGEMKTSHDTQCLWNPLIVVQGCPGNLFLKLSFHKCSRKLKRAALSSCISLATKGQLPAKWHLSAVEGPELLVAFLFSVPFLCLSPVLPRDVRCCPKPGHPVLTCADWHNVSTNYHPGSSAKAEGETSPDCILCNSMHCSCRICVILDIYLISLHDIKCTVWP